jgi:hypothetical protein
MNAQQRLLAGIIALGGLAVIGSYAFVLNTYPGIDRALWGGVPGGVRPVYTFSMFLAAAGFFAFTFLILFRLSPQTVRLPSRLGFRLFLILYLLILVPSAVWMPLTATMIEHPNPITWLGVRLVLVLVGLSSLELTGCLIGLRPRPQGVTFGLALAGSLAFCVQTVLLDAIIWPAYFPGGW